MPANKDEIEDILEQYGLSLATDGRQGMPKEKAAQLIHAREASWWICTNFLNQGGKKKMGPFITKELALEVRALLEEHNGKTYAVDQSQLKENKEEVSAA